MKKILLLIILFGVKTAFSQQQATFSQYMFNGLAINPAYAGSHDVLSATALVRYQSLGVDGAPNTQTFAIHSPLLNKKIALGILLVNDKIGVITQRSINVSYAFRISFTELNVLSFGLQTGFSSYDAEYSKLQIFNSTDPAFNEDITSMRPNFGAGIFYHTDQLYIGVSIPHLVNNVFDRGADLTTVTQDNPILLNAGFVFNLASFLKLKPNILVKFINQRPVEIDLNANLLFDEVLWIGASVKTLNSVSLIADLQLTNQIRLGYSYALSTNDLRQVDMGSHEFMINYKFKYPKDGITTPRHF